MRPANRLADHTTLGLGGPSRAIVEVTDEAELVDTVCRLDRAGEPVLVVGGGSNLVVGDAGFDGTVVLVATRGIDFRVEGEHVDLLASAGEPWDELVVAAVSDGLSGIEALAGIPGRTGATPIQNVGAYGQEVASTIRWLRVLDRTTGEVVVLAAQDCAFGYRTSVLKRSERYVVLAVDFQLERSAVSTPVRYSELARVLGVPVGGVTRSADVREAVLDLRRGKGMVLDPDDPDTRSVGSFFTNPVCTADEAAALPELAPRYPQADGTVKISAAWLIEQAGFARGYGTGGVAISTKHTLALTNRGTGTTTELLALAREVRDGVRHRFGVDLAVEPVLVGCSLDG